MTMTSSSTPNDTAARKPLSRRLRDTALIGGLLAMFLVGLIGLAAATGWEETMAQIRKLTWAEVLILLALSMVNYLFRGLRWHMFARCLGLPTTLGQDIRHFFGGFAMSVTPGRVGELIRMRWLKRETGWSVERTAPLVLVDRASDLAAMAVILGAAALLAGMGTGIPGAGIVAVLALGAAIIATRPALLSGCVTLAYRALGVWPRLFAKVRGAARSLRLFGSPRILSAAALLGVIGWLAEGYAFHLLLMWMGADIGFWSAVAIFTFSTLAGGLTGAPGGVGGAEAAMIALLGLQGIPLEVSIPATAIIRVTTLWFAIGLGLLTFPIAERISKTHQRAPV
ncbi:flippase-like domain-containing protein [Alphaproteobacteria bacterium KMM 3653]|uniref:Flippase-like domain-containing protein n=1 Tax=Harenicola maris TaxID=2841044 RepID=A0AAP2CLX8_9RHOB|nr:flippase-like domain-containing protein [Harenicola maris]